MHLRLNGALKGRDLEAVYLSPAARKILQVGQTG